jgi:uncharacterized membrane protein YccC
MFERMTEFIGTLIVVLIVLLITFFLINHFTGGKLVRLLVCGILFWIPFGAAASMYCYAIPV